MTPRNPLDPPQPPRAGPMPSQGPNPNGTVRVQKREVMPPIATREKICATCGRTFRLTPEEKYFNCPHCHKKTQPVRKAVRKNEAQILTQITCVECGTLEYVDFVPTDAAAALCAECFSRRKRELQGQKNHKERR